MDTETVITLLLSILGFCGVTVVGLFIKVASDVNEIKTTLAVHVEKLDKIEEKIEKHETVFITEKLKTAR